MTETNEMEKLIKNQLEADREGRRLIKEATLYIRELKKEKAFLKRKEAAILIQIEKLLGTEEKDNIEAKAELFADEKEDENV